MLVFLKAKASSLIASAIDFVVMASVVNVLGTGYLAASIAGTVLGGVINFMINRRWVFDAAEKDIKLQAFKYLLVWVGNLVLVTLGVYLLGHFLNFNYLLSKLSASVIVGVGYNYMMQRHFIF